MLRVQQGLGMYSHGRQGGNILGCDPHITTRIGILARRARCNVTRNYGITPQTPHESTSFSIGKDYHEWHADRGPLQREKVSDHRQGGSRKVGKMDWVMLESL